MGTLERIDVGVAFILLETKDTEREIKKLFLFFSLIFTVATSNGPFCNLNSRKPEKLQRKKEQKKIKGTLRGFAAGDG
ncbi:hypothetical protein COLO4_26107 [Corchorus olitorius]|uniref:Uncharacterized protein n=1 Tax=Corchorus olitorius TaxID=93759 RepID=A0A1R3HYV8_9ROSI|nr:hypothetical protein COLO4_26107 [Corchorus olitorius]